MTDRGDFLNVAALFEGGLVAVAFVLGWLAGINPLAELHWDWRALAVGAAAALPMALLLLAADRFPIGPLRTARLFVIEVLGPPLAACRWYDLIVLALVAGLSEELLFRGVLQPWFERWNYAAGLIGSNVLFGLGHAVTLGYAVMAGIAGVYLGLLFDAGHWGLPLDGPHRNLLVPVTTHAVYDYLAFLIVIRAYRTAVERGELVGLPDEDEPDVE